MNNRIKETLSSSKVLSIRFPATVLIAAIITAAMAFPAVAGRGQGGGGGTTDHNQYLQFDETTREYILTRDGAEIARVPEYEVERSLPTELCGVCHQDAVAQLKNSVHYSLKGPNPRILFPGGGAHGLLDRASGLTGTTALINHTSNVNLGECGKCHVGRFHAPMEGAFTSSLNQMLQQMGLPPEEAFLLASANAASLVDGGLDCLICHADHYRSVRDDIDWDQPTLEVAGYAEPGEDSPSPEGYPRLSRDNTDFDHDGQPDLLLDIDGDGAPDMPLMQDLDGDGVPETPWPTIAQDRSVAAVLSVGKTDERNCLRCHQHDRTGYERGTLFRTGYDAHANVCFPKPRLTADDPKCPDHNACTACHVTLESDIDGDGLVDVHKFVRGHLVGGDVAAADYPPPPPGEPADPEDPTHLTCVQCHDPAQLSLATINGVHTETHLAKIACETCHITRASGLTYSVHGHGGSISFGRNTQGEDTKVITLDHMLAEEQSPGDIEADFEAYRFDPVLMWFNGSTSYLAQSLAIRGSWNAKITPFKPMANGMVMDARFFRGDKLPNEAIVPYPDGSEGPWFYNAYSVYRFYANALDCDPSVNQPCSADGKYGNAEVLEAFGLLGTVEDKFGNVIVQGQTPEEVRTTTLMDLLNMERPDVHTMAMMQAFPNLMQFSKTAYGLEHYLVSSDLAGSVADVDGDGVIDQRALDLFKMYDDDALNPGAVNVGLMEFKGFNQPMFLPPDYDWYPPVVAVSDLATIKLPDGKFMKLFLAMQLQMTGVPPEVIEQLIGSYPAFSNGVTLGGHGIAPDPQQNALGSGDGYSGCRQCHVEGGVLETKVPVSKEKYVATPLGGAAFPVYRWKYYNVNELIALGLTTVNEDVVAGIADIDVSGDSSFVRESTQEMVLNWFDPAVCADDHVFEPGTAAECFVPGNTGAALAGTDLSATDLTWGSGGWMPVLEPVTTPVPNYQVLGYQRDEVIWAEDDPRINPEAGLAISEASWQLRNANFGKLKVVGMAPAGGAKVSIINAVTQDQLFTLRADTDGSFAVNKNVRLANVPCTVAAKVGDLVSEAVGVENAPAGCVGAD